MENTTISVLSAVNYWFYKNFLRIIQNEVTKARTKLRWRCSSVVVMARRMASRSPGYSTNGRHEILEIAKFRFGKELECKHTSGIHV